jgi:squalene-hopene/tetraprenyl-beta-curcumene cyclase
MAKSDGGIYGDEGLGTYNTSLAVMALLDAKDPKFDPILLAANRYLVGSQHDYGEKGTTDNAQDGGIGYGGTYKHSDMSNTQLALQALKALKKKFENVEDRRDLDLDWEAAITFVSRCQQNPATNKADWVSQDKRDEGGVVYFPGNSKSEEKLPDGRTALRSYGSMTYAGLMSFIYADLKKDDPRVVAALKWLRSNYTLEENPGLGEQGLFYYYHTMAKALNAYGASEMDLIDGKRIDWRKALALHLFNLQKPDGYWVNENGRWWEKDSVLVTCYAILTLEEIHASLVRK